MRDLRVLWPRWVGFICLFALMWQGLARLEPDTSRLVRDTYVRLAGSLDLEPEMVEVPFSLSVEGGVDCETGVRSVLGPLVVDGAQRTLNLTCRLEEGRAYLKGVWRAEGQALRSVPEVQMRLPSGFSLLPPMLAILFAFFFQRIGLALLAGILVGGLMVEDYAVVPGVSRALVDYLWSTASDPLNLYVYGFTVGLIGTVNVCVAMGGMQGVIQLMAGWARGARSTQVATALMGLAVFFDDYANSVVVGGAARPLTDAHRISREKLAYIVDSTAAPVAGLAVVSTWIGIEVKTFAEALDVIGPHAGVAASGYGFFFQVLPYRFYCLFALALVFIVGIMGRDFGPMLNAERRARRGSAEPSALDDEADGGRRVDVKTGAPPRWWNGVIPVVLVLGVTLLGSAWFGAGSLIQAGQEFSWLSMSDLGDAFVAAGAEDYTFVMLFVASVVGTVSVFALALAQRILTFRECASAWFRGVLAMLPAIAILVLAMSIRGAVNDLMAAEVMVALLGNITPLVLPLVIFLLAGIVAFATGTSFATILLLVPVAIPLAAGLTAGHPDQALLLALVGASVLDGAIFGDHCSPISDTTVMSSVASGCDHVSHVRTQIPYAVLAMLVAALAGYLMVAWTGGGAFWLTYPIGGMIFVGILRWFGSDPGAAAVEGENEQSE